ncbi:hypothetical protein OCC_07943 [Thermococcus litoralis DSM 5473]|uniref:Uncharacterized protein n=1 Tax=Thermococcus litoralis (strain ATCC 51850 / DSM 5473 / JCM 8560 / NS-C) TaxID=523849 RepID=H3ZKY1_THELN|nr:hypothetical protein OCC_07943 [Thermococcus litoralis DSM 5473]
MKKPYGLKILIKWDKFMDYVEEFSSGSTPIWEKYNYVSSSRLPTIEILLHRNQEKRQRDMERVQRTVKNLCKHDLEAIDNSLNGILEIIETTREKL